MLAILTERKFQPEFAARALSGHLGGLLLLRLYFSWGNLLFGFLAAAITAYAMGLFHHMYFPHASFRTHPAIENPGTWLGTRTWRGLAAPRERSRRISVVSGVGPPSVRADELSGCIQ